MKAKRPKKPETSQTIPFDAAVWLKNFIVDFEENFESSISLLPSVPEPWQLQQQAAHSAVQSLLNAGMDIDSVREIAELALSHHLPVSMEWGERHNQRRIELIDKDIQGTLTKQESAELSQLTRSMREYLRVHHPLDTEGTRLLHQKLIAMRNSAATELK